MKRLALVLDKHLEGDNMEINTINPGALRRIHLRFQSLEMLILHEHNISMPMDGGKAVSTPSSPSST